MVVIRCQRRGTKKTAKFRIVVTERAWAQSSRVLEVVGQYDPMRSPATFAIDESRLAYWVSSGAKVSEAVDKLLRRFKKLSVKTV